MNINTIKSLLILFSITIFTYQATANTSKPNHHARVYYKPVTVLGNPTKGAQSIGIYQRTQIGNDGAYGTFTQKGTTLSQTVLEYNSTTTPISGITDKPALGYIQNTNPGASSLAEAASYLGLYAYTVPITIQTKTTHTRNSMAMKTAQYTQAQ